MYDTLTDTVGGINIESMSKSLSDDFDAYLDREDITNGEDNYFIGDYPQFSRYMSVAFLCPAPMSVETQRRAFPCVYHYDGYSYLTTLAGSSHSINALKPYKLEIVRSSNYFKDSELIEPAVINDGGTMRAIDPDIDDFFVNQASLIWADSKLWIIFGTFDITSTPVTGYEWTGGETYAAYSSDNGTTWSELIEIDPQEYVPSSKPIVVGNEIWYTGYGEHTSYDMSITDLHSYVVKYNFSTQAKSKVQLDADWTNLYTTEPVILEYATGKFICIARVNWNANFPGAESSHKGLVIAYSTDGVDWSDYTFYDEGSSYPNQPKLFMHRGYVYLSWANYTAHGTVAGDESEIEWIVRNEGGATFLAKYGYFFHQYWGSNSGWLNRYNPLEGSQDELLALLATGQGSIDFCLVDLDKDLLLATCNFKKDGAGYYVGEPWVAIVKKSGVGSGPVYNERLLYMVEVPGDYNTSNTIKLWNDWVAEGNEVRTVFYNDSNRTELNITKTVEDKSIEYTISDEVDRKKIIIEVIKT